jgi:hypothetical protein
MQQIQTFLFIPYKEPGTQTQQRIYVALSNPKSEAYVLKLQS